MATIFVINPGSTSTKLALYGYVDPETNLEVKTSVSVPESEELTRGVDAFVGSGDTGLILDCVVARGGLLRPCEAGIYQINKKMLQDLEKNRYGVHASNYGALVASKISQKWDCPAIIADPVTVDEFWPLSRYSGFPGIERRSRSHVLSIRAVARRVASELGKSIEKTCLVVAHIGGGISVAALQNGRIVDVNDSHEGGPFTPQRAGSLPILQLAELCFSGRYKNAAEVAEELTRRAGLKAYLGSDDGASLIRKAETQEMHREVLEAMSYQIAKEIGASAAALDGEIEAVALTGGLVREPVLGWILRRVEWIAPVFLYPGELEMQALAEAGQRFLRGEESAQEY